MHIWENCHQQQDLLSLPLPSMYQINRQILVENGKIIYVELELELRIQIFSAARRTTKKPMIALK
jgi:hypothetical protein